MKTHADFPGLLQAFFTDRLMRQQQASPNTIAAHRDTFRLLIRFAQQHLKKRPSSLRTEDLTPPFIGAFLDHLEKGRGNSARTRNARLAAIRSFFRYVAVCEPALCGLAQRVAATPNKRWKRKQIDFLSREEARALLAAPDQDTWLGRRDFTLLLVAMQTGLRVSELVGLKHQDVCLRNGAHVRCFGKGRKERCTPLRKDAVTALRSFLRECGGTPSYPVFPSTRGGPLSRDAVEYLVAKHAAKASMHSPSLRQKRVSPHVLRHTAAMDLLQHGVGRAVIALWLGHESMDTVDVYIHADMELKERALARTAPHDVKPGRYKPAEELLAFLQSL